MFRPILIAVPLAALSMFLTTCDRGTAPGTPVVVAYQVPGCTGPPEGISRADACFSYTFHDALLVDFCATGNCCPDSDRFSIGHSIEGTTITIEIADTAAQLCRCLCTYRLHVEFHDLKGNSYLFIARRTDESETLDSLWVYRE